MDSIYLPNKLKDHFRGVMGPHESFLEYAAITPTPQKPTSDHKDGNPRDIIDSFKLFL